MEFDTSIEISVKSERVTLETEEKSPERAEKSSEDAVWIKREIEENSQDVVTEESLVSIEVDVKQEFSPHEDNKSPASPSKLPLKKRKTLGKSDEGDVVVKKENGEENAKDSTQGNGQSGKAEESKEQYIMYSYEVIKNIQIVTITEEERQVEHAENIAQRKHMKHFCEDCAVGFVLESAYKVHMKIHTNACGEYECDVCHSHLKNPDILYHHKLRHYRRYRCLLCWSRFKDKDTAACHVMTDHVGTSFTCDQCGRGFKRPQYLKQHIEQAHTKALHLVCPVCSRVFHERSWFRSHVRNHNEEVRANTIKLPATCGSCGRTFKNKSCLRRHVRAHETSDVPCTICRRVCKTRHLLAQHYREVHRETYDEAPEETCAVCLRVCATRAMLNRHMRRMHQDRTKKYQCDHCQRYYLTKGEVRSHIAWSHSNGSPRGGHACPCGRVFRSPSLLRAHHERFHEMQAPVKKHACDTCGKAFANKQVLNRHKKSHSDEMFPCNACGLLFKTQPYVKIHYQLKHLNMTRAEINAKRKLNKHNRIPQNNLHVKTEWENQSDLTKPGLTKTLPITPELNTVEQMNEINVKIERESDDEAEMSVPLFQTFVDVKRN